MVTGRAEKRFRMDGPDNNNNSSPTEQGGDDDGTSAADVSSRTGRTPEEAIVVTKNGTATGHLTVLHCTERYVVVSKPPAVLCHHSEWTGLKHKKKKTRGKNAEEELKAEGEEKEEEEAEFPMVQRVREAFGGRRANLVHRLDRPCSGCLLLAFADEDHSAPPQNGSGSGDATTTTTTITTTTTASNKIAAEATTQLIKALAAESAQKTYVAIVRGEGIFQGRDFTKEGWFMIERPIKDERGVTNTATTWFRFVASQTNQNGQLDRPRASIVLARPVTGRWHQIRRHLNGIGHPIIGDNTHGDRPLNRLWKQRYGLLNERCCLHLTRLEIGPTELEGVCPQRLDVRSAIPPDLMALLRDHLPQLLADALPVLQAEGILLEPTGEEMVLSYRLPSAKTMISEAATFCNL